MWRFCGFGGWFLIVDEVVQMEKDKVNGVEIKFEDMVIKIFMGVLKRKLDGGFVFVVKKVKRVNLIFEDEEDEE